jgi:HEAT repeat protein
MEQERSGAMLWLILRQLKSHDELKRVSAAEKMGAYKEIKAVQALIAALSDPYFNVRAAAAESLGQIGNKCAVEPLSASLKDSYGSVREKAARALGKIKDARVIQPLIEALKDPDDRVRQIAIEALKQNPTPKSKEALSEYRRRVKEAAQAAKQKQAQHKAEEKKRLAEEKKQLAEEMKRFAEEEERERLLKVNTLLAVMKDDNNTLEKRKEAARRLNVLGWKPNNTAEQAIRAVLVEDWKQVVAAKSAAVPMLLKVIEDPAVRPMALLLLRRISDGQMTRALLDMSDDPGLKVRQGTARGTDRTASKRRQRDFLIRRYVEPLRTILEDGQRFREHASALDKLSVLRIRDESTAQVIVDWYASLPSHTGADVMYSCELEGYNAYVAARNNLERILDVVYSFKKEESEFPPPEDIHVNKGVVSLTGQGPVPKGEFPSEFVSEIPKAKEAAFRALLVIGSPAVGPLVTFLRANKEEERHVEIIRLLARIKDKRSVQLLEELLLDKSSKVRKEAAYGLEILGWQAESLEQRASSAIARGEFDYAAAFGPPAMRPLIGFLKNEDLNPEIRLRAIKALAKIDSPELVDFFIDALRAEDPETPPLAAKRLTQVSDLAAREKVASPETTKLMIDVLLKHRVGFRATREWAMEAIVKMGSRAVEPLIAALDNSVTRMDAIEALGKIGDPRAIEPLTHWAKYGESSRYGWESAYGSRAAQTLAKFGRASIDPLLEAAWHGNSEAEQALREMGEVRLIEPLLSQARSDPKHAGSRLYIIEELLQNKIEAVPLNILQELARLGDLKAQVNVDYMPPSLIEWERAHFGDLTDVEHGEIRLVDCSLVRRLARRELARHGVEE